MRWIFVPRSRDYDLRQRELIRRISLDDRPEVVIHTATLVGGIGANHLDPGRFLYENAIIRLQLIQEAKSKASENLSSLGPSVPVQTLRVPLKRALEWISLGNQRAVRDSRETAIASVPGIIVLNTASTRS